MQAGERPEEIIFGLCTQLEKLQAATRQLAAEK
jgi:hypothetical protein